MPSYCNPMNLNYRFQVRGWADKSLREAADPSVVTFQGRYWLFPSKTGGYWHSTDLHDWTFVPSSILPAEDYAPDVRVINGLLYFTASRSQSPSSIYRTANPLTDAWEHVSDPFPFWDPNMFQDDDGKVYLYWGCSNKEPIRGVELNPQTMLPVGEPEELIFGQPGEHGWERGGDNNATENAPWIEGAWMTRHGGRYYLQYAGPGTEWNVYADGVYTGPSPLGPFEYARHNPFSLKPGGFINGAGHGSTFQDRHGNWWHIATMRISVKHQFERRLGLFPAGFDEDGLMFCNTLFGDYPTRLPQGPWDPWHDAFAGWMLLSRNKTVTASSTLDGHAPELAVNEDIRTWWSARTGNPGEWLQVDLGNLATVHAVQLNFAEQDCDQYGHEGAPLCHQYLLEGSENNSEWFTLCDRRNGSMDVPHDFVEIPEGIQARFLRLTNRHMPGNGKFALSGLRVFGKGVGKCPPPPSCVSALRDQADPRAAKISWAPTAGAVGYNVRWGIAPDKLYSSWMVYDQTELELRLLTKGVNYWIAVDVFNEVGVSCGKPLELK